MAVKFVAHRGTTEATEMEGLFGGRGRFRRWTHYTETDAPPFTVIAETDMATGAEAGLPIPPTGRFGIWS